MNAREFFIGSLVVCGLILTGSVQAEDLSDQEVLSLPEVDFLKEVEKAGQEQAGKRELLSFSEEASGNINFLADDDKGDLTRSPGPRFLPSGVEHGIGGGLKGIMGGVDRLTDPITRKREITTGSETVIEIDPKRKEQVRIEF
jgi:hypothetical protein